MGPPTTEIYSLSLHDALPISRTPALIAWMSSPRPGTVTRQTVSATRTTSTSSCPTPTVSTMTSPVPRSEEHTSELQSLRHLVCRLLLEKKKQTITEHTQTYKK